MDDLPHGFGRAFSAEHRWFYEGEYVDGAAIGRGVEVTPSAVFSGEFEGDTIGSGAMYYEDGSVVQGPYGDSIAMTS